MYVAAILTYNTASKKKTATYVADKWLQKSNKLNLHSSLFFQVQLAILITATYVADACKYLLR